jgi:hypothetical protein
MQLKFCRRKKTIPILALAVLGVLNGQEPPAGNSAAPAANESVQPADISGSVSSMSDGKPLSRASVALKPEDSGLRAYSDTTDAQGRFYFPGVEPGRYSIEVARDGYLNATAGWYGEYRFPPVFTLHSGRDITGLEFKLYPWGVMSGHIAFNDAEPAVGAEVTLFRDTWWRGRHVYAIAGRTTTDDRGEYRIHGLAPGSYVVSAAWQKPVLVQGAQQEPRRDAQGRPLPDEDYAVTFYPDARRLVEAVPVQLRYGEVATGVDIFLTTARTVRIAGRVRSGLSGVAVTNPSLTLRRTGADNTAAIAVPANIETGKNGEFQISGVVPGSYYLIAEDSEDGKRLLARRLITVGEDPIENVEMLVVPAQKWFGRVMVLEDPSARLGHLRVELDPRDETAQPVEAQVREDGEFSLDFMPEAVYDVYVKGLRDGMYVKSVTSAGTDLRQNGVSAPPGATPAPMQIVLSRQGAEAIGAVMNADRTVAPGVNIDLIPDPPAGRYQDYQESYSDEYGNFHLTGIAPGRYLLLAWAGEPPCDIYDPERLDDCRAFAAAVTLSGAENTPVSLMLATPPSQ